VTLGNHEFDFKGSVTADLLRMARFPMLAANIEVLDTTSIRPAPFTVLETESGLRLAVVGISNINFPTQRFVAHDPGDTFARHEALRDQANALIALTHIGFIADLELARRFPRIDVIIGGHSHTLVPEAIHVSGVLLAQAGGHAHEADQNRPMFLGKIVLEFEDGELVARCGRVIQIDASGARLATRFGASAPWVPEYQCARPD
jgi:2',3'-cyclic-nucleotide 2'-phosphodiesterase (5'-nucleotidase family)